MIRKPPFADRSFCSIVNVYAALIILGLTLGVALRSYSNLLGVNLITSSYADADYLTKQIYSFYAFNQYWPDEGTELRAFKDEAYVDGQHGEFILEKGSLHIVLNSSLEELDGKTLSFRKAEVEGQADTPVLWVCGYAQVPTGMSVNVENRTDLDEKYLIKRCR